MTEEWYFDSVWARVCPLL